MADPLIPPTGPLPPLPADSPYKPSPLGGAPLPRFGPPVPAGYPGVTTPMGPDPPPGYVWPNANTRDVTGYTGPVTTPGYLTGGQAQPGWNPMANFWGFLGHLFGGGPANGPPQAGPAQGMRGLLQQMPRGVPPPRVGRGAPGTDQLGNPIGRF
jgi:hypothetical protein